MITIIAAFDKFFNIGKNNSIPWYFPEDLINFKNLTTNNVCIMGRNTWESLPEKFRPLPNRINIIISESYCKNPDKFSNSLARVPENAFEVFAVASLEEALSYCNAFIKDKEVFIIGGSKVYSECLSNNCVDKMIITKIKNIYDGDVKFPDIDWSCWSEKLLSSNENFDIVEYIKK